MNLQAKAKKYAIERHAHVRHLYDNKPYELHLNLVVAMAKHFIHLIPEQHRDIVIAACWCHDLIEDTRETYNDLVEKLGLIIAEIVYAVTNEKGKTRKERANYKYYLGIRMCKYATFVKLCDRIANTAYSHSTGSKMFNRYKAEHVEFVAQLYHTDFKEMFDFLEEIVYERKI